MFVLKKYTDKRAIVFATDSPLNGQIMNKNSMWCVMCACVCAETEGTHIHGGGIWEGKWNKMLTISNFGYISSLHHFYNLFLEVWNYIKLKYLLKYLPLKLFFRERWQNIVGHQDTLRGTKYSLSTKNKTKQQQKHWKKGKGTTLPNITSNLEKGTSIVSTKSAPGYLRKAT